MDKAERFTLFDRADEIQRDAQTDSLANDNEKVRVLSTESQRDGPTGAPERSSPALQRMMTPKDLAEELAQDTDSDKTRRPKPPGPEDRTPSAARDAFGILDSLFGPTEISGRAGPRPDKQVKTLFDRADEIMEEAKGKAFYRQEQERERDR